MADPCFPSDSTPIDNVKMSFGSFSSGQTVPINSRPKLGPGVCESTHLVKILVDWNDFLLTALPRVDPLASDQL